MKHSTRHPRTFERTRRRLAVLAPVTAALATATLLVGVLPAEAAPSAPSSPEIVVGDGTTQPVFSYEDAIRETVFVESTLDGDRDGALDLLQADVIRPRETEEGLKVPVIFESSPYYRCCGRGNESERKEDDDNSVPDQFPLFYDNYFVPRGYAVVLQDMTGTRNSKGCEDVGGRQEILGAKAVVDWLNGRARAFDADGSEVRADWTTGKVGMIGKSWDGSVANGVAATGVRGLETIVPIGAISSWYDYHRVGGIALFPNGPVGLHNFVNGRPREVCTHVRDELVSGADDATGDYNRHYWAVRDYVKDAEKVRASVFVVHGLNDWNVDPKQYGQWWDALERSGVPRKIWLSQVGHQEAFDFRRAEWVATLHRWFDHWLHDVANGIMSEPMADVERAPDVWEQYRTWPDRSARPVKVRFGPGVGELPGTLTTRPVRHSEQAYTDDPDLTEREMVEDQLTAKPGRLVYLSPELTRSVRLSGTSFVDLVARADEEDTNFTVRIVDYGAEARVDTRTVRDPDTGEVIASEGLRTLDTETCWGESSEADDACYKETEKYVTTRPYEVVTRGWLDAENRSSLSESEPLVPGRDYRFRFEAEVEDYVFKPGHRIGVVIAGSDDQWTIPDETGATVTVSLGRSSVWLPIVGGRRALGF